MRNFKFYGVFGFMADGTRLTIDYRQDKVLCDNIILSASHSLVGGFSVLRNARGLYGICFNSISSISVGILFVVGRPTKALGQPPLVLISSIWYLLFSEMKLMIST